MGSVEAAGSCCDLDGAGVAVGVVEGVDEACRDDATEDEEGVFARELEEDDTEEEKEEDLGEAAAATFLTGVGIDACEEVVVTERTDEAGDESAGEGVADPEVEELAFVEDTDDWPGSSPV